MYAIYQYFQDLVIQTQLIHFQPFQEDWVAHKHNTSHDKHSIWLLTPFNVLPFIFVVNESTYSI